jgi:hypothetical protein
MIKSSIIIVKSRNIGLNIKKLANREFYKLYDQESICYYKRKPNNRNVLKIPYFNTYNSIIKSYTNMILYLYKQFEIISNNFNLDYIFFISYDHRTDLFNIKSYSKINQFNNDLIDNLINNPKYSVLILNTKKYLKLCDPKTYSIIDYLILNIK